MAFEIGKTYTFNENDFEVSRKNGRLFFLLKDPASTNRFKILPKDFQKRSIPKRLECVYVGKDKFEQSQPWLLKQVYRPGEVYTFKVQQKNKDGGYSLSDDENGINHPQIQLGKIKLKRWDRIKCRVKALAGDALELEYIPDTDNKAAVVPVPTATLAGPRILPIDALPGTASRMLRKLPPLNDEAQAMIDDADTLWPVHLLENILQRIVPWLAEQPARRIHMLGTLRTFAVALIEQSPYLALFSEERQEEVLQRITHSINEIDAIRSALTMMLQGTEQAFTESVLHSIDISGRLYEPERKAAILTALIRLKRDTAATYIDRVLDIIVSRHADATFMRTFTAPIAALLHAYVDSAAQRLDIHSRTELRRQAYAIAVLLLLTRRNEDEVTWDLLRARLYNITTYLTGRTDVTVRKAILATTGRLEMPLEYSWDIFADIHLLFNTKLQSPIVGTVRTLDAIYADGPVEATVAPDAVTLGPTETGHNTRVAFMLDLGDNLPQLSASINARMHEKADSAATDLHQHHLFWNELEAALFDPNLPALAAPVMTERVKTLPPIGAKVMIRVTARDSREVFSYFADIVSDEYEGHGRFITNDITSFPVRCDIDMFQLDGKPLLLPAVVDETEPDGNIRFKMRAASAEVMYNAALSDYDSEEDIPAIITGGKDSKQWYVTTNAGYTMRIDKMPYDRYVEGEPVWVRFAERPYFKNNGWLQINGYFVEHRTEGEIHQIPFLQEAFRYVVHQISDKRTWSEGGDDAEAPTTAVPAGLPINARQLASVSTLIEGLATTRGAGTLADTYSMLAFARVLARLAADHPLMLRLAAKMRQYELLASFAVNSRLDPQALGAFTAQYADIADTDLQRRTRVLRLLACLDRSDTDAMLLTPAVDDGSDEVPEALRKLVLAYNIVRGASSFAPAMRMSLLESINKLLGLPLPKLDVNRINAREDHYHEFKSGLVYPNGNDMQPDVEAQSLEIMQQICGFMNADGGTVYLGVNDSGVVTGLDEDFKYLNGGRSGYDHDNMCDKWRLLFNRALERNIGLVMPDGTSTFGNYVTITSEDIEGKWIYLVDVKPWRGDKKIRLTNGTSYIRSDNSTKHL